MEIYIYIFIIFLFMLKKNGHFAGIMFNASTIAL